MCFNINLLPDASHCSHGCFSVWEIKHLKMQPLLFVGRLSHAKEGSSYKLQNNEWAYCLVNAL